MKTSQYYRNYCENFSVLSKLLRSWRGVDFKDRPDLQSKGGRTSPHIGENDHFHHDDGEYHDNLNHDDDQSG